MKRWIWLTLAAVLVIAAGVTLVALPTGQEWTTSSPEALAEFEVAMEAQMKLYYEDVQRHIEKAVELDPDFVIAKLMSVDAAIREDEEQGKAFWDEVLATDTSKLTPRERYYIERSRAYREERPEDIPGLTDEYLAKYPNDPYVLNRKAVRAWAQGELEEAERLYRRLVEISPNWVIAYNQLGYINMGKGRFAEAEEYFKSYRFIAPDQANPYDSLGELYIALGRYGEAEESFESAIEVKPHFWASYEHIVLMKTFNGELGGARDTIVRAEAAGAPEGMIVALGCLEQYMTMRNAGQWQAILDNTGSKCIEKSNLNFAKVTTHLAACELGAWDTARTIEAEASELLAKYEENGAPKEIMMLRAGIDHLEGVRMALQGDFAKAGEKLRAADESLDYGEARAAIFKLYNRMILTELLLADGKDAEAHGLLAKIRGVNPLWVEEFEDAGLKVIGLERG
jgi:tetratricopeptide (TPR) repeat protein